MTGNSGEYTDRKTDTEPRAAHTLTRKSRENCPLLRSVTSALVATLCHCHHGTRLSPRNRTLGKANNCSFRVCIPWPAMTLEFMTALLLLDCQTASHHRFGLNASISKKSGNERKVPQGPVASDHNEPEPFEGIFARPDDEGSAKTQISHLNPSCYLKQMASQQDVAVRTPSVNAPKVAKAQPAMGMPLAISMPETLSAAAALAARPTRMSREIQRTIANKGPILLQRR